MKNKINIYIIILLFILLIIPLNLIIPQQDDEFDFSFGLEFNKEAYEKLEWSVSPYSVRGEILPSNIDISDKMPEPREQGKQNSCVGWAVGYAYRSYQRQREAELGFIYDDDTICSPSYIYNTISINRSIANNEPVKDIGVTIEEAMELLRNDGCLPLSLMPYNEKDNSIIPPEGYNDIRKNYIIPSYQRLTKQFGGFNDEDIHQMKSALAGSVEKNLPGVPVELSVVVSVFWSSFIRNDNILDKDEAQKNLDNMRGGHATLIVGYDDNFAIEKTGNKGAFRIMNSWGTNWADGGFFWMSYDAVKLNGMEGYRIGKNPDLPDLDVSGDDIGSALNKAVSIRTTVVETLFGKEYLIEQKTIFDKESKFFYVDYDFTLETKFKVNMTFLDEYSVFIVNITPKGEVKQLFPYPDRENVSTWVYLNQEYSYPATNDEVYTFLPDGPKGREFYVILLSDRELKYKDLVKNRVIKDIDSITNIEELTEKAFTKIKNSDNIIIYPVVIKTAD